VGRISWERLAALAGVVFIVFYIAAFVLGIEVGNSDREILDYYASSSHRVKELIAFFLIAGAALALIVFAAALRSLIRRPEQDTSMLGSLALAGGTAQAALILAGNAVSRGAGFASMDKDFHLDPNTRRYLEDIGYLLFVSGALAGILLVVAVSLAALRYGLLPRWLGWTGFAVAVLLPTAIAFLGFLIFVAWMLAVSVTLATRQRATA
jgi:uncharacterized membrane protein YciS (DUF1049 family)